MCDVKELKLSEFVTLLKELSCDDSDFLFWIREITVLMEVVNSMSPRSRGTLVKIVCGL